ncbi:hypothetical protein N0V86_008351 [Didymella sp. IMI 355093]|nr:hypothetical protein N0V86_008351 [Didymella sp. IMI 355093]
MYTFFRDEEEFLATVPVTIILQKGSLHRIENGRAIWDRSLESIQYFWLKRNDRTLDFGKLPADIRRIVLQYAIAPGGKIYIPSEFIKPCLRVSSAVTDCSTGRMLMGIGYTGGRSGYKLLEGDCAMYPYQIVAELHPRVYLPTPACFSSASDPWGRISKLAGMDR